MQVADDDMEGDDLEYQVVMNGEEQYSIWLTSREVPAGWQTVGYSGSRSQCLDHIETVWTDMRPLSVRRVDHGQ